MRTFALAHDGIITRIQAGDENPFHHSLHSYEVTGTAAQVGNTVDAVGNVGPSVPMSPAMAAAAKGSMLRHESHYRGTLNVWLQDGDTKRAFDTGHGSLAVLAALAESGCAVTLASDGTLAHVPASEIYAAASKYRAAVLSREGELQKALADDAKTDIAAGWPDTGEDMPDALKPPEPVMPVVPVLPTEPAAPVATGNAPEQTVPPADLPLDAGGTVTAPAAKP